MGYLTVKEVMEKFKLAKSTLYYYMDKGLPYIQIASIRVFKEDEVKDWLSKNRKV